MPSSSGSQLSQQAQAVYDAWIQAGGPKSVAPLMVALAYQQSGFSPTAVNSSDPGPYGSVGLWQINSAAHPGYFSGGPGDLMTDTGNAAAAVALYNADGVQPWYDVDAPGGGVMENPIITAWQKGGAKAAYAAAGLTASGLPSGDSKSPGLSKASTGTAGALSSIIPSPILHGTAELIMRTTEIALGGLLLMAAGRIVKDAISHSSYGGAPSITRAAQAVKRSTRAATGG
jgi:hypothetical protein